MWTIESIIIDNQNSWDRRDWATTLHTFATDRSGDVNSGHEVQSARLENVRESVQSMSAEALDETLENTPPSQVFEALAVAACGKAPGLGVW